MTCPDHRGMGKSATRADARGMHGSTSVQRQASVLISLALLAGVAVPLPVSGATSATRLASGPSSAPARISEWSIDARVDEHPADRPMVVRGYVPVWRFEARQAALSVIAAQQAAAEAQAAATKAAATANAVSAPAYVGKNHLWIPALGMSRSVATFACTRAAPPANRVYRWGCAGRNNVYLFGHAWGVMKPLHDGYIAGRVKVGMVAKYADAAGRVRTYRVTEIRVVTPDKVSWAIAGQSRASMTLQTCIGSRSDRRLLVRLVADR